MTDRIKVTRLLLCIYALGSLIGAVLLASGRIGSVDAIHLAGTTSGKVPRLGLAALAGLRRVESCPGPAPGPPAQRGPTAT